jgi:hypothetical protein
VQQCHGCHGFHGCKVAHVDITCEEPVAVALVAVAGPVRNGVADAVPTRASAPHPAALSSDAHRASFRVEADVAWRDKKELGWTELGETQRDTSYWSRG